MPLALPDPLTEADPGVRRNFDALARMYPLRPNTAATGASASTSPFGEFPATRVYNTANLPVVALPTVLTFNSERFDTDNIHSTSTNTGRLTCVTPGIYTITGNVSWDNAAVGGTYRQTGIRLNGTTYIALDTAAPGITSVGRTVSASYRLAATDYVDLAGQHDAGGTVNIIAAGNYSPEFSMVWPCP